MLKKIIITAIWVCFLYIACSVVDRWGEGRQTTEELVENVSPSKYKKIYETHIQGLLVRFEGLSKKKAEIQYFAGDDRFFSRRVEAIASEEEKALWLRAGREKFANHLEKSKELYIRAADLFSKRGDKTGKLGMAFCLLSAAETDIMMRNLASALKNFKRSVVVFQEYGEKDCEALATRGVAKVHVLRNQNKLAEKTLEDALRKFKKCGNQRGIAHSYRELANLKYNQGRYDDSINYSTKAINIFLAEKDLFGVAYTLINLGHIYTSLKEVGIGKHFYTVSFKTFKKYGDIRGEAISLRGLGYASCSKGALKQSAQYYEEALKIFKQIKLVQGVGEVFDGLGRVYMRENRLDDAKKSLKESLKYFRSVESQWGIANVLRHMGDVYWAQENHKVAEDFYWRALGLFKEIQAISGEAKAYLKIGEMYYYQEKPSEETIKYLMLAYAAFEKSGSLQGVHDTILHLARVEFYMGNFLESKRLYKRALKFYEMVSDDFGKARCFYGLSKIASYGGKQSKALGLLRKAWEGFNKKKHSFGVAKTFLQRGITLYRQGDYMLARDAFMSSLKRFEKYKTSLERSRVLSWMGSTYFHMGRMDEAKEVLQHSLSLNSHMSTKLFSLEKMAMIAEREGDIDQAIVYYQQILKDAIGPDKNARRARVYRLLGLCYLIKNDFQKARKFITQSMNINKFSENEFETMRIYLAQGDLCFEEGDALSAYEHYKKPLSHEIFHTNKRILLETHLRLGRVAMALGNLNEAIDYFSRTYLMAKEINSIWHEGNSLLYMGVIDVLQGNLGRAVSKISQALMIFDRIGYKYGQAVVHLFLGRIELKTHHSKASLYSFKRALDLFGEVGNIRGQARTISSMGTVYYYQKEPAKALEYHLKAQKMFASINNFAYERLIARKVAADYVALKNFDAAEKNFNTAHIEATKNRDRPREVKIQLGRAHMAYKNGQYMLALKILEKAQSIAKSLGRLELEGRCVLWRGANYLKIKKVDRALRELMRARRVFSDKATYWLEAMALRLIGKAYFIKEEYEKAASDFKEGIRILKHLGSDVDSIPMMICLLKVYKKQGNQAAYKALKNQITEKIQSLENPGVFAKFMNV